MRKLIGKVLTRRDTSANWTKNNPILGEGECGYATDLRRTKHGDGTTRWNSLPWDDAATANGHSINSDVPEGAKFTDTTYSVATSSADGLMSKTDKAKLDDIGAGSNVKSVNGKTGAVTLSKADVGLGNVDNTKDADKPISTAVQTALDAKANNSVATESTDGLMSAADKTKLDGITSTYATKSELSSHSQDTSNPHKVTASQVGALPLSGGSLTGNLTAPSFQTGTGGANYFQCRKFRGEGDANTYYHAVDFGFGGHDQVDFYEYGGKYVFHKHQQAAKSSGDAIIGEINSNGFVGKVNGHTINADVPAGAKFTDTTYSNATTSVAGLMSPTDKAKLDGIGTGSNVKSVNGKTGAVTLEKGDVGLGSVDNTKDVDKPISIAMQTALDKKADKTIATSSTDGLMSKTDKAKLDGITGQVTADKVNAPDHTTDLVQYGAFQIAAQQIISQIPTDDSISETTMNFTSSDVEDGSATAWTSVPALASGEKHSTILGKVSQMFKNVRYLFKMLGTTDISGTGDGTVTGAIIALNADLTQLYKMIFNDDQTTDDQTTWEKLYPVGSVYISFDPTDPGTLFGGTWEQIKDRFLLAAGDTYAAGSTGGEATHTLTVDEMPSHSHDFDRQQWHLSDEISIASSDAIINWREHIERAFTDDAFKGSVNNSGGSQPHNNMPPYLAVYMWKRTA
jgi:hypothetical protein